MEALQEELDNDPDDGVNDPRAEVIRLQTKLDETAAQLAAVHSGSAKLLETNMLKNKELRDKNKALEAKVPAATLCPHTAVPLAEPVADSGGGVGRYFRSRWRCENTAGRLQMLTACSITVSLVA